MDVQQSIVSRFPGDGDYLARLGRAVVATRVLTVAEWVELVGRGRKVD